jgi:predicted Zn finger-like uncharacterized protein
MTLATRCTACGTSFRVVQDQLKVSGGWVRCGRCNEVFNALDGLYEIFTQPVDAAPSAAAVTPRPGDPGAFPGSGLARLPAPTPRTADSSPAEGGASAAASTSVDVTLDGNPPAAEAASGQAASERSTAGFEDAETRLEPRSSDDLVGTPSFMQPPREVAVPATARSRLLQVTAGAVLAVTLLTQLAYAWRDSVAAHAPGLRPLLESTCAAIGCRVESPRNLAALTVEGSNLRQRNGDGLYELVVALRNRSPTSVRAPAFELTLIDNQGKSLIRRVLTAGDMGAAEGRLPGGSEWNLQVALQVDDRRIAGYTVEIFYP